MEKLLGDLRGNLGEGFSASSSLYMAALLKPQLVIYPTRFLEGEDISNKFLFNADRLLPLQIHI